MLPRRLIFLLEQLGLFLVGVIHINSDYHVNILD